MVTEVRWYWYLYLLPTSLLTRNAHQCILINGIPWWLIDDRVWMHWLFVFIFVYVLVNYWVYCSSGSRTSTSIKSSFRSHHDCSCIGWFEYNDDINPIEWIISLFFFWYKHPSFIQYTYGTFLLIVLLLLLMHSWFLHIAY